MGETPAMPEGLEAQGSLVILLAPRKRMHPSTISRRPTAIRGSSMPACLTHGSIEGFSCPKCRAGLPREGETVVSEGQPGYWSISQETAEAIRDIEDRKSTRLNSSH